MSKKVFKYIILALLVIVIITTFPWNLPDFKSSSIRYIFFILQICLLAISVGNLYWGTTLESHLRKFEVFLEKVIQRRLEGIYNLEGNQSTDE